ncbi:MAG: NfeD family protein [Solirubrobacteraceae bacterium]|nr:NfeD family protein [Patulibacter sp.]
MSALFWVILAFGLGVIEILSVTFFPIFFTISAIVALFLEIAGASNSAQWATFGVGGLVLSGVLRPIAKRQLEKGPTLKQRNEGLPGRHGVVTTEIGGHEAVGVVSIDGQSWSAKPASGQSGAIPAGADVEIIEVRGATLVVAPVSTGVQQ